MKRWGFRCPPCSGRLLFFLAPFSASAILSHHLMSLSLPLSPSPDSSDLFPPCQIFDHIMELHAVAHAQGIHTISVDIPPSVGTNRGPTKYRKTHESVNQKLRESSLTSDMRVHVSCPINWYPEGHAGSELWEEDGLHMSGPGYQELGNGLAPEVYRALTKWGIVSNSTA